MILKVFSAEELSKKSNVPEEIIRKAFKSGALKTVSFSKKQKKYVTSNEEFNRWLRKRMKEKEKILSPEKIDFINKIEKITKK